MTESKYPPHVIEGIEGIEGNEVVEVMEVLSLWMAMAPAPKGPDGKLTKDQLEATAKVIAECMAANVERAAASAICGLPAATDPTKGVHCDQFGFFYFDR